MRETDSASRVGRVAFPVVEFLALFVPIAVLILVVGYSIASLWTASRIQELQDRDSASLQRISGYIGAEVSGSLQHLRSLATESTTVRALDSNDPRALRQLQLSFLTLARRNPQYQQVRWIDESGLEKIRVTQDQGEPHLVVPQDLQDKSERYYFKSANAMLPGELYISRVDLNVEHGQIELPPRPMLRIATPLEDSNRQRRGIIVINISMQFLFDIVRDPGQLGLYARYFLINPEGLLLTGQMDDPNSTTNPDQSVNFAASHPAVWSRVSAKDSGSLEMPYGLWIWKRVSPLNSFHRLTGSLSERRSVVEHLIADDFSLTLVAYRTSRVLIDLRSDVRMPVSLVTLVGLAVYGFALFLYLSGHTRARRAELSAAYAMARAANMERMKELDARFHRLVDASGIGFLVVDDGGRIDIANAAAEGLLGYAKDELKGVSVDKLLSKDLRGRHAQLRRQFMSDPQARRMGEGRELKAVCKDGSAVSVEIGLNPYSDQSRQLVLVSIIDLSNRKPAA